MQSPKLLLTFKMTLKSVSWGQPAIWHCHVSTPLSPDFPNTSRRFRSLYLAESAVEDNSSLRDPS